MAPQQEGDAKSFLSRWSQRKRAAEEEVSEAEASQQSAPSGAEAAAEDDAIDPKDLPDIDSLDAGSDYSVFLKKGVPAGLKRKALNKLWQTDPAFRTICMLDDYNLDYTDAAMVVPNLKTLFQVGRGMVLPEEEEAAARAAAEAADKALEAPQVAESAPGEAGSPTGAVSDGSQTTAAPAPQSRPKPLKPGTPRVQPAATRAPAGPGSAGASAPRQGERSARQRRWGDPDGV
jgi:hypothetical protein